MTGSSLFDSWATCRRRCWARRILPEELGLGMLAESDVHVLGRGVSEVGDPTAEDLSPRKVAVDTNSNDRTADAVFSYCSRAVKATARWTMANLGRSGRRVGRRTDARGKSRNERFAGLQRAKERRARRHREPAPTCLQASDTEGTSGGEERYTALRSHFPQGFAPSKVR